MGDINLLMPTVAIWVIILISGHYDPERQSAWMLKTTNDDLTWSGTGCFIAVPIWQQRVNVLNDIKSHNSISIPDLVALTS